MEKNIINNSGPQDGSILASIDKKARLYTVPAAYFEGLSEEIMTFIRTQQYTRQLDYQVPKDYFAGFAAEVLQRIKSTSMAQVDNNELTALAARKYTSVQNHTDIQDELAEVAPLLLQIGNKNVYQVPDRYFQDLSPLAAVSDAPVASTEDVKVIPITRKKKFWRAAVAAAAVLGVLFSGERYFKQHEQHDQQNGTVTQFAATISNNDSFQQNLSGLSDGEIDEYLKSQPDLSVKDSIQINGAVETQAAISGMTNEELEAYLERTPAAY